MTDGEIDFLVLLTGGGDNYELPDVLLSIDHCLNDIAHSFSVAYIPTMFGMG